MLSGMLCVVGSGTQQRELPECYGPWQSAYSRFSKWWDEGIPEAVLHDLSSNADMENPSSDSTSAKVHQSANGRKKTENKAVGRSRDGLNTEIYAAVGGLGNPVEFPLSAGNDHDFTHVMELLKKIDISGSNMLGNKA